MEVSVRPYAPDDAAALANVMWRSVRIAALADYSVAQTEAWLPAPHSPERMHRWASDGRNVLVATSEDGRVVGYMDLEADGHIDHLCCAPEVVGTEVAGALYDALERLERDAGVANSVSRRARPPGASSRSRASASRSAAIGSFVGSRSTTTQ